VPLCRGVEGLWFCTSRGQMCFQLQVLAFGRKVRASKRQLSLLFIKPFMSLFLMALERTDFCDCEGCSSDFAGVVHRHRIGLLGHHCPPAAGRPWRGWVHLGAASRHLCVCSVGPVLFKNTQKLKCHLYVRTCGWYACPSALPGRTSLMTGWNPQDRFSQKSKTCLSPWSVCGNFLAEERTLNWCPSGGEAGTGTGCPGRFWSLLLWRDSRPAWTRSSTSYCRWPWFGRRVGLDDPQRSLPTPTILWFWGPQPPGARPGRREPTQQHPPSWEPLPGELRSPLWGFVVSGVSTSQKPVLAADSSCMTFFLIFFLIFGNVRLHQPVLSFSLLENWAEGLQRDIARFN